MPDEGLLAIIISASPTLPRSMPLNATSPHYARSELVESPVAGDFDLPHLQAIHHHLFRDVYEWAGELYAPFPIEG